MVVIGHYRVSTNLDGKGICEMIKSINNPLSSVLKGLAREFIGTAQKSSTDATANAVVKGGI